MSEMQADIEAALTGAMDAQRTLADVEAFVRQVRDDLARRSPLPAPALTEDAIVAALKADPAMAGRVIVCVADGLWAEDRLTVSTAAKQACNSPTVSRGASGALQSLAVALAAASYRG